VTLVPLLAACLFAIAPAQADAHQTRCTADGPSVHTNGTARFYCAIKLKPDRSATLLTGRLECAHLHGFDAYAHNGIRWIVYDRRSRPTRSFRLRDESRDLRNGRLHKLRVHVYQNHKLVKFVNESRFEVELSFTMRCPA
jgi:hypothetical protein